MPRLPRKRDYHGITFRLICNKNDHAQGCVAMGEDQEPSLLPSISGEIELLGTPLA
jgi:hypothetical protein